MKTFFSIIIPAYNAEKTIKQCLNSISNQTGIKIKEYEIIIIDDGSTDNTKKIIKKLNVKYKNLKYFYQANKGPGSARNRGIKIAKGEILIFTDHDCVVEKTWLKNIKKTFEDHPEITGVGGGIENPYNTSIDWANYILNFSKWFPSGKKRIVKDVPAFNLAYRKKKLGNLKFLTDYKWGYEDSRLNYRLVKKKKIIIFDPNNPVMHYCKVDTIDQFLNRQRKQAISFFDKGYEIHGIAGLFLIKFKFLNLFCPRLLLVFLRCLKSPKYFYKFIIYFPLILKGELERGLTIIRTRIVHKKI